MGQSPATRHFDDSSPTPSAIPPQQICDPSPTNLGQAPCWLAKIVSESRKKSRELGERFDEEQA